MEELNDTEQSPALPMPGLGDVLFQAFNQDYKNNAIVSSGIDKFFLFSDGYKAASQKLFQQLDGNSYDANTIVYPLIFLNRQFLELRLKELISGLNYISDHNRQFPNGHNLSILWTEFKKKITVLDNGIHLDEKIFPHAERLVLEFNDIDPGSFSFRYPVDTTPDRNPSLKMKNVDLLNFQTVMTKLYHFLDGYSFLIFHLVEMTEDFILEMQSMYEREMASYYGY